MSASPTDETTRNPLPHEIEAALVRVLHSAAFLNSRQLQRMLRFLVEEMLAGHSRSLKEYAVGVNVFERPASYDPRLDSIVRVEARRLRAALDHYYETEGRTDPVVIEVAKGSYIPTVRHRADSPAAQHAPLWGRRWLRLSIGGALILATAALLYWSIRPKTGVLPPDATLAVLPFENLSKDPENEYFCFGLMDQITTDLAKNGRLRVVARTSAARFKRGDDIAAIARALKSDAILEGSVRKSGSHLLVTAQLINAADSLHVWSDTYERESGDVLTVQDEIAQAIAGGIRRYLTGTDSNTPRERLYSANPEAKLVYWKGSYLRAPMGRTNWRDDLLRSAGYLEQAVQKDDRFARAYSALADVYLSLAWERGGGPTTREFMSRARSAATRALELDDRLAEAWGALGTIQFFHEYDPPAAEPSFQRALKADPNDGKSRMWYAYALVMQRRFEQALAQAEHARQLDPLSYVATTHLAVVNYFSRRCDEASRLVRETLEVANTAPAHGLQGMILAAQGRYPEAIAEYMAGLALVPTHSYIRGMLGHAYASSGRVDEAKKILNDATLEFEKGGLSDLKVAYIHVALGDRDRAFSYLERDFEQRDPELPYINVDPVFDPVRDDPRFTAIVRKMGLAP